MISAVVSAAIAVTSLSVCMTTGVSAVDSEKVLYSGSTHIEDWNINPENNTFDGTTSTLTGSEFTDYQNLTLTVSFSEDEMADIKSNQWKAQCIVSVTVVANDAYSTPWQWISAASGNGEDGGVKLGYDAYSVEKNANEEFTVSIATSDLLANMEASAPDFNPATMSNRIVLQTGWVKGVTIHKLAFTDPADTNVYYEKPIFTGETKEKIFVDGVDFNKANLTENAKLKVWYSTGEGGDSEWGNTASAGWGIGKICAGTEATLWDNSVLEMKSEGTNKDSSVEVKFSSFAADYDRFVVQVWEATSKITKVAILDTVQSVAVESVTLDETTAEFAKGSDGFDVASKTLTATVAPENATDKTVTWTSSDEAVATVADGVVTPVGVGKATITVTTKDGEKTASCEVTVKPVAVTSVTIGASTNAVEGGDKVTLDVEIAPANALDKTLKFTSSDETVATVDADGNVTFAMVEEEKTVDITAATTYTNADFGIAPVSDTITFTVTPKDVAVPVTGVSLDKTAVSLAKGETVTLTETITPADADVKTVTWSTSDEKVATVLNGVVTAVEQGTATITVKTADGGFTAECAVTVTAPKAEEVTVLINGEVPKDDKFSMMNGRTRKISATVAPEDAVQDVTYTVADPAIVSVENGVVTAKAEGTTTITAAADGAEKTITVEVTAKSNVPYTTEEGIIIFDGKGTSSGWGQAVVMYEYDKGDGPFRISDIKEGMKFKVYYASSAAPELIFQSWSGGASWAKISPVSYADGVAVFTYDDIVKAYGSSDFSTLDAINVGDTGAALSVTKVVMVYDEEDIVEDPDDDPDDNPKPPTPPTPPTPVVPDDDSNTDEDDTVDADDDTDDVEIDDVDDDLVINVGIPVSITTLDEDEDLEDAAKGIGEILTMFSIDTGTANPKGEFDACIGSEFAGKTIDLYKYNEETGELEFVGTFDVDENGYIKMYYNGSADYVAFESGVNGGDDKGEGNPGTGVQTTAGVVGLIAAAASAALFISAKKKEN